jgi:hypothetical protein
VTTDILLLTTVTRALSLAHSQPLSAPLAALCGLPFVVTSYLGAFKTFGLGYLLIFSIYNLSLHLPLLSLPHTQCCQLLGKLFVQVIKMFFRKIKTFGASILTRRGYRLLTFPAKLSKIVTGNECTFFNK